MPATFGEEMSRVLGAAVLLHFALSARPLNRGFAAREYPVPDVRLNSPGPWPSLTRSNAGHGTSVTLIRSWESATVRV